MTFTDRPNGLAHCPKTQTKYLGRMGSLYIETSERAFFSVVVLTLGHQHLCAGRISYQHLAQTGVRTLHQHLAQSAVGTLLNRYKTSYW